MDNVADMDKDSEEESVAVDVDAEVPVVAVAGEAALVVVGEAVAPAVLDAEVLAEEPEAEDLAAAAPVDLVAVVPDNVEDSVDWLAERALEVRAS